MCMPLRCDSLDSTRLHNKDYDSAKNLKWGKGYSTLVALGCEKVQAKEKIFHEQGDTVY